MERRHSVCREQSDASRLASRTAEPNINKAEPIREGARATTICPDGRNSGQMKARLLETNQAMLRLISDFKKSGTNVDRLNHALLIMTVQNLIVQ